MSDILTRPAYTLTTGELLDLLAEKLKGMLPGVEPTQNIEVDRIRVDGISGLARYLGVSVTTAQKLKNQGKITTYQAGKCVYFYSDEIDNQLRKENKKVQKKKY